MPQTLLEPVKSALLAALERRGIPREDVMRDQKLIPNRISLVRIILAPVPAVFLVVGPDDTLWRWLATTVFVLLIATDGIDGWIARTYHQTSELGKVLDPIGDKLLIVLTLIAMLWVFWDSEFGWLFCLFVWTAVAREVILTAQIRIAHDIITSPTLLGKVKTVVQALAIGVWLIPLEGFAGWSSLPLITLAIAFVVTVASWWEYDWLFVRSYRRQRRVAPR